MKLKFTVLLTLFCPAIFCLSQQNEVKDIPSCIKCMLGKPFESNELTSFFKQTNISYKADQYNENINCDVVRGLYMHNFKLTVACRKDKDTYKKYIGSFMFHF